LRLEEAQSAAERLLQRRLANAAWPRSALVSEARLAGIPCEAIDAAVVKLGIKTIDGRWSMVRQD